MACKKSHVVSVGHTVSPQLLFGDVSVTLGELLEDRSLRVRFTGLELPFEPLHPGGMSAQPVILHRCLTDRLFELLSRHSAVFAGEDTKATFGDGLVRHRGRPVAGSDFADADGSGKGLGAKSRVAKLAVAIAFEIVECFPNDPQFLDRVDPRGRGGAVGGAAGNPKTKTAEHLKPPGT